MVRGKTGGAFLVGTLLAAGAPGEDRRAVPPWYQRPREDEGAALARSSTQDSEPELTGDQNEGPVFSYHP